MTEMLFVRCTPSASGDAVYVRHVSQKKPKWGIATPKSESDLIRRRLRAAEKHYQENYGGG